MMVRRLGVLLSIGRLPAGAAASRPATWLIGHVVSPLQRRLYQATEGRFPPSTARRLLLLTVPGRRTGRPHTTPLFYVRDGSRLIVCNVRPRAERENPWVANVRAARRVRVQVGGESIECAAQMADADEVAAYWPSLVRIWPAYESHFSASGERTLFVLEP